MTHAYFDHLRRQRGITMIELMIVLTIVAILGALAVPSYRDYVVRTNRAEAANALLDLAACQEKLYIKLNQYDDTRCGLTSGSRTVESGRYQVNMTPANNNQTFTLTATPLGAQAEDSCGTLAYTSEGDRTPAECW